MSNTNPHPWPHHFSTIHTHHEGDPPTVEPGTDRTDLCRRIQELELQLSRTQTELALANRIIQTREWRDQR